MHVRGADTQQNAIVFKNSIRSVEQQLKARLIDENVSREILTPLYNLLENDDFWQNQANGLSVLCSADGSSVFQLGFRPDKMVRLSDRFEILPLLAELDSTQNAYVLFLSDNEVKLWQWSHGELSPEIVPGLPENRETALQLDYEESLQTHVVTSSAHGGSPVEGFHGHGGGRDKEEAYRREFIQKVQRPIREYLGDSNIPLILATVERNFSEYRRENTYPYLEDNFLQGNFDGSSEVALKELKSLLQKRQERQQKAEIKRLSELDGGQLLSDDLQTLLRAVTMGQVEQLILPWPAPSVTGAWDGKSFPVEIDSEPNCERDQILDIAAEEVFAQQGRVSFIPAAEWESTSSALAKLRWTN
jgi:hypothetical protein